MPNLDPLGAHVGLAFWLILGLWEAPGSLLGLRAGFECSCALRGAFRCRLVVHFGLLFGTIWGSFWALGEPPSVWWLEEQF